MQTRQSRRSGIRWGLGIAVALAVLLAALELTEQDASEDAAAGESEPAVVEPIDGTSLHRVRLSASAAQRLGVRLARVERGDAGLKTVPYAAVLYDERGRTWVYTSPERLSFVRARVAVRDVRGETAVLATGPPVGTSVAVVGAAELYGAELGVDH